jgi:hypothetical protein
LGPKKVRHAEPKRRHLERLVEKDRSQVLHADASLRVGEGGDEHDWRGPARVTEALGDVETVHHRHTNVGDDEIDGVRSGAEPVTVREAHEQLVPVGDVRDLVAVFAERLDDELA